MLHDIYLMNCLYVNDNDYADLKCTAIVVVKKQNYINSRESANVDLMLYEVIVDKTCFR